MLDGLLGRGFASKYKALIKSMKKRIDVIRRKRNATQKFLKKDIADLLANGLDINAYGRAEGLLVELKVSSCYDFVEQCSDFVMKHLLILQKLSTCPEDCREAVSSLMFAAARFSDLPELRDLREMHQEKYGNSLEHFVNQEFVENLASKPATLERRVQLMRNIALEYSIMWDSVAFEKRMSRPPVNTADEPKTYGSSLNVSNDRSKYSNGKETESRGAKHDLFRKPVNELANGGHRFQSVHNDDVSRRIELTYPSRQEFFNNGDEICNGKVEAILTVDSHGGRKATALCGHEIDCRKGETAMETLKCGSISLGKREEQRIGRSILCNGREIAVKYEGDPKVLQHVRLDVASGDVGVALKDDDKKPSYSNRQRGNEDSMNLSGKLHENENRKLKPDYRNSLPPPYINSSSRMKDYNPAANCKSPRADNDNGCSFSGFLEQIRSTGGSEKSHLETSPYNHERDGQKHVKDYRHGEKDLICSYINSSSRMKDYNPAANCKSPRADNDNGCSFSGFLEQIRSTGGSEKSHLETSHYNHERDGQKHVKDYRHGEKDQFYDPRMKDYNHAANCKSPRTCNDNSCSSTSYSKRIRFVGGSEKSHLDTGHSKHEREGRKRDFRHDEKDQFYDARLSGNSLPKPRSIRRKHSKSHANYDVGGNFEDTCVTRRKSRSRRRDESKGLKLLTDEEKHQKDEEERIIDKLLIHYSKKPSKLDPAKARKKPRSHHMGELPRLTESLESTDNNSDTIHSPDTVSLAVRSFSLPREQIGQSVGTKVFTRAASFQPNGLPEAKHVHPNLPDYEDLTARFAALRGR